MTDAEDFESFFETAEPRLRLAFLSAYGPERGREAACEALAYAWEHWNRIKNMEHPVPYLYRVGQSRTRSRRTPTLNGDRPTDPAPWVEPGLERAIGELSNKQRMAVVLVHAYGWTHAEAAKVMQVRRGTVKTHLERGLEKLRSALEVPADV